MCEVIHEAVHQPSVGIRVSQTFSPEGSGLVLILQNLLQLLKFGTLDLGHMSLPATITGNSFLS